MGVFAVIRSGAAVGQPDLRNACFVQVSTRNGPVFVSGSDNGRGFDSLLHHQTEGPG